MTLPQYNEAKLLTLDLLGWGVHPEYLLDYGLSHETAYYVFSELNLRRPSNLDITDIPPYIPPLSSQPPASATLPSDLDSSQTNPAITMPPPVTTKRLSVSHSLPAKPGVVSGALVTLSPTTSLSPSLGVNSTQSTPNLHDMEAQRRQELLARKAVYASRKLRGFPAPPESADTNPTNDPPNPSSYFSTVETLAITPVATELVDDFLNSIEASVPVVPTHEAVVNSGVELSIDRRASSSSSKSDAMDVDEREVTPVSQSHQLDNTKASKATLLVADSLVGTLSPSTDLASSRGSESGSFVQASSATSSTTTNGTVTRKGTKRPVAADFVDYEPSAHHGRPSSSSHSNGHAPNALPYMRRKLVHHSSAPFANLMTTRRCVIDLSDSEEEARDDDAEEPGGVESRDRGGGGPSGLHAPVPSRTSSAMNGTVHRLNTPPATLSVPTTPTINGMSPAALEERIKKMKELIAVRELNRQKKLSLSSVSWLRMYSFLNAGSSIPWDGRASELQSHLALHHHLYQHLRLPSPSILRLRSTKSPEMKPLLSTDYNLLRSVEMMTQIQRMNPNSSRSRPKLHRVSITTKPTKILSWKISCDQVC